ncbi:pantoate--beta-alanine ligase [Parasediminibacterium paludis]|uniref:Pantothenate synthetase n=1 Tax=Parasediminibacterium paludis TaxID=908966 RepID=A0ABV8PXI8_9BACT
MILFKTIDALQKHLYNKKNNGISIGFVPTMGALHQGHLSLISMSKTKCAITVCSIFVNPTQFNDSKDFEKYPITIENDIRLLELAQCDVLFLPSANEIYPKGTALTTQYQLGYLETLLEGKFRPHHFQGVCQVVHTLLDIVTPDMLFLGQKDYQQCMVIQQLLVITGIKTQLMMAPTLRENSGLAMSSRNMRLNDVDKEKATVIYQSLKYIKQNCNDKLPSDLIATVTEQLLQNGFEKIDYVAICNANDLQPLTNIKSNLPRVALIAAFLNGVRLIDNLLLDDAS